MFIFPLTILKIIDSDKFINFKQEIINKYLNIEPNYMDSRDNNPEINTRRIINDQTINQCNINQQSPDPCSSNINDTNKNGEISNKQHIEQRNQNIQLNYSDSAPNLNYLSNVLDINRAFRNGTIHNNWYYLSYMLENNIEDNRLFKYYKGDINKRFIIDDQKIKFVDNMNKELRVIYLNDFTNYEEIFSSLENNKQILDVNINNNNIKDFTLIKDNFINYNKIIINNDNINIKHFNAIEDYLKNSSFWSNYNYIKYLYSYKYIDKLYFNQFIINLINESIYQSDYNRFLIKHIHYLLDNSNYIDLFELKISNEFIYLNGNYSIRLINNENKHLLSIEFIGYYWESLLDSIDKELLHLKRNSNSCNNEKHDILLDLYKKYINIDNYPGVKGLDNNNNIIPLRREILFNKLLNNENSIYRINFDKQINKTFYYLNTLNAFIFKYNNEPIWIDCNTKVTLSHYINNINRNLRIKIIDFYNQFYLFNSDMNINNNNLDLINEIIFKSNMNIKNHYTDRLINFKNLINQIIAMERALKLDIPNLDKNLIQNQNNIKLLSDNIKNNYDLIVFPDNLSYTYEDKLFKFTFYRNINKFNKFIFYDLSKLNFPIKPIKLDI
jgi:hypothetical protein